MYTELERKAHRVIRSCKTEEHLKTSERYIDLVSKEKMYNSSDLLLGHINAMNLKLRLLGDVNDVRNYIRK